MNNDLAKRMAATLKRGGVAVKDVTCLGVYAHIDCRCEATAILAGKYLTAGGFEVLKIGHYRDLAKGSKPGAGAKYVDRWTCHVRPKAEGGAA